jgi:hypothetical protein
MMELQDYSFVSAAALDVPASVDCAEDAVDG